MRRRALVPFIALLAALTSCRSQKKQQYLDTFEQVWKTVNETYFDSTFGGLRWEDVRDRYLPRIAAAETDEAFYRLVNTMLWELNVSHANLVAPGLLARREPLLCAEGSPGLDVRVLDAVAVITSITPGSPAQEAGLRPGYVIRAVDGIRVEQIAQEAVSIERPPRNSRNRVALVTKAILGRIYGTPGTAVSIAYSDGHGNTGQSKMVRTRRSGTAVGPRGILYFAVEFEARRLDQGIGYIRLNTLQPPLVARVSDAIGSMKDAGGIVLDLRGNSGGEIEGLPELFLKERALLFLRRSRTGDAQVFGDPASNVFGGPLVVLVDQLTGSAAELFAACLQAMGRVVVVGKRSPGAVVESDMTVLPNGAIFMYPVAQLATPDGTVLEGHGVVPDIEIGLDREMLLKGVDSQLQSAIGWLAKGMHKQASTAAAAARTL